LQLASHYDNHSDFYYWRTIYGVEVGAFSDQEQIRVALHKLLMPSSRYTDRPLTCDHGFYLQAGPDGQPMFVHRFGNKFAEPGSFGAEPAWTPGLFPMETIAWQYFLEWMSTPLNTARFPEEVPGWFTQSECDLWARSCAARDVLELGRFHGRSTIVAASTARRVVSLDRGSDQAADFWLQRYNLRHKAWLRVGQFDELVPTSGGPFSACLIDGMHDLDSVDADIRLVLPHLDRDSLIGFHDYGDSGFPGVKLAADQSAQRYGWEFVGRADYLGVFRVHQRSPLI
jgi:hypothetical protein